jgi:competence protein ComEA
MGVDPDKARIAGYAAAAVLVVVLAFQLLRGGDDPGPQRLTIQPSGVAREAVSPPPVRAKALMVQVAGEVRKPGVYSLPAGTRGADAVERAGGLTSRADQAGVNLVAPLRDGQQVIVPRRGATAGAAVASSGAVAGGGAGAPAAPVSLSSATIEQLDTVDGIGPTLAQRIVEYRQAHGGFRSVDELNQVGGIGEKRMAALRKAVTP